MLGFGPFELRHAAQASPNLSQHHATLAPVSARRILTTPVCKKPEIRLNRGQAEAWKQRQAAGEADAFNLGDPGAAGHCRRRA